MEDRSGWVLGLLVILVLANIVGFGLIIDSYGRMTQSQADTEAAIRQLNSVLTRLENKVAAGQPINTAATNHGNPTLGSEGTIGFANEEFRDPEAVPGGRRVSAVSAFSNNLNYMINNEGTVGSAWGLCNDSLAERNYIDVKRFEPVLAQSWEISEDGLTYTIRIRPEARWHAYIDPVTKEEVPAQPVTADDFVFWWETLNSKHLPETRNLRTYYKSVKSLEKVDEHTIRVTWKEPYSLAMENTLGISPWPKHYYRPDPEWTDEEFAEQFRTSPRNQHIVGCGPYRLVDYSKTKGAEFEVNHDYYGSKPAIQTIRWDLIADPEIRLESFKKGKLDVVGLFPLQWHKQTTGRDFVVVAGDPTTAIEDSAAFDNKKRAGDVPPGYKFEKYSYYRFAYYFIAYNQRRPIFQDKRVRRALTHLTDRKRILKEVFGGLGAIPTGPFSPLSPYNDPDVKPLAFDVEQAKALLTEAGWEDTDGDGLLDKDLDGDGTREPFRFSLMICPQANPMMREYGLIMQSDMKKAGVDLVLKSMEWSVMQEREKTRDFDASTRLWGGGIESDPYQIWHGSQTGDGGDNHVFYKSEKKDQLIEQGRREVDLEKRIKIYREFHRIVNDDQPYTFLFIPAALVAQSKRYQNVRIYKLGMASNMMWVPMAEQITE